MKIIATATVPGYLVGTIYRGRGGGALDGHDYETTVIALAGAGGVVEVWRHRTEQEAREGHDLTVAWYREEDAS